MMKVNLEDIEVRITQTLTRFASLDLETVIHHGSPEEAVHYSGEWEDEDIEDEEVEYYIHNAVSRTEYDEAMDRLRGLEKLAMKLKDELRAKDGEKE